MERQQGSIAWARRFHFVAYVLPVAGVVVVIGIAVWRGALPLRGLLPLVAFVLVVVAVLWLASRSLRRHRDRVSTLLEQL